MTTTGSIAAAARTSAFIGYPFMDRQQSEEGDTSFIRIH
jgi:hypothetical protein